MCVKVNDGKVKHILVSDSQCSNVSLLTNFVCFLLVSVFIVTKQFSRRLSNMKSSWQKFFFLFARSERILFLHPSAETQIVVRSHAKYEATRRTHFASIIYDSRYAGKAFHYARLLFIWHVMIGRGNCLGFILSITSSTERNAYARS